jgi:hypothetical protein
MARQIGIALSLSSIRDLTQSERRTHQHDLHQLIIVLRAVIITGRELECVQTHTRHTEVAAQRYTHYFMNDGTGWENKQVERTKREKECGGPVQH